jgi:hypothetical protein
VGRVAESYSYGLRRRHAVPVGLIPRNGRDNTVVSGDVAVQTRGVLDNARDVSTPPA